MAIHESFIVVSSTVGLLPTAKETVFMRINMKSIKEVINEIEHIPKCPRSGEINLYYIINLIREDVK